MSTAIAVHVLHPPARLSATIVGDDANARRKASRLLSEAGFDLVVLAEETELKADPDGLIIFMSTAVDTARVHAIKTIAHRLPNARILAVMPTDTRSALLRRALVAGASGIILEADLKRALAVSARAVLLEQLSVPARLGQQ